MDFYLNNRYDGSVDGGMQGTLPTSVIISARLDAGVLNLINGQILTGEITDIEGKEIQILLENNQVIHARLTADISMTPGQVMSFQVKQGNGNQIALTPLFENMEGSPAALKALKEAGMPANERTVAMVTSMMEEGMSVSRENLFSMFRIANSFREADVESLVQMSKLNLPITEENIVQYEADRENHHQIANSVVELAEGLSELPAVNGKETAISLIEIFTDDSFAVPEKKSLEEGSMIEKGSNDAADRTIQESPSLRLPVTSVLDGKGVEELFAGIKDFMEPEEAEAWKEALQSGKMEIKDALTQIAEILRNAPSQLDDKVQKLLSGKEVRTLLKEAITGQWLFSPEEVEDKEKVEALFRRIVSQSERTGQLLSELGKADSPLMKGIENIKQNVRFMNQLNEMFTYVQLPLKLGEEKGHGDLYVYTNKKKLAEKDGEVTALLHLEMEYLGTMDVHVALRDGNQVKTHFYLEKEELLDFVEEHLPMLNERLSRRGYQMVAETSLREPEKDAQTENHAVSEMFGGRSGSERQLVAKYSFDARA